MRHESVFEAGAANHVADTLPDLVQAIHARPATALKQRLKLRRRRTEHKRWHDAKPTARRPHRLPAPVSDGHDPRPPIVTTRRPCGPHQHIGRQALAHGLTGTLRS